MGINIHAYNYVSEVPEIIDTIKKNFPDAEKFFHFVVPSRADKFWFSSKKTDEKDLWTWDEIYKNICESDSSITRKRILSPPDHLLILDSILKEVFSEYPDKIKNLPGLTRPGFLSIISRDIRELLNEAVKPGQLDFNPESDNPSEFLLPEVYARYIKYLDEYNLLDSAEVYTAALEELIKNQEWGKEFFIIFVGFLSFTHAQLELLYALRDRCAEVIILKPETNLKKFYDADLQLRGKSSSLKKSSGKIVKIPVAEPGLEPEAIARSLALYDREKFDDIGIMISNGREDYFAEAFERYGVPYDFVSGIKINLTLPGKILTSIRHLTSRNFPTYETAMLLTQPCFAGSKFPVMKVYRAGPAGLDRWEEFLKVRSDEENIFQTALISIQAIKKFKDAMTKLNRPERIMQAFYDFLTAENLWLERFDTLEIANTPELDEILRNTASAIETVAGKVLALNELLPDLGAVQNEKLKNDEAWDFLERWCANTDTRAPVQISNAVRIFTNTPPVLASFPVWIMTGVTQKTWSGNVNSSPLLGNAEREKLAAKKAYLPTTFDKAAQHEALFRRLIQIGEKVTIISNPELDEEGRPLSESPFMQKFLADMPEWKSKKNQSGGIKILLHSDDLIFPEIDAEEKIFREPPVISKKFNAVGASDVHKLLSCSFLWWQEKGANLYAQDTEIVSQIEWGLMLHKFWERVWRRYRADTAQDFSKISEDEWKILTQSENLDEEYKNFSRLVRDFRLKRKLQGLEYRVRRLSNIQSEVLKKLYAAGYSHEKILLEEEAYLRTEFNGVAFLGQCDRIEIFNAPDGGKIAMIADYKEGVGENSEDAMTKIENYSWNFEKREKFSYGLQLSVYAALFAGSHEITLGGVYILGLEDGKISGSFVGGLAEFFKEYKSKKFKFSIAERIDEGEYAMACAAEVLNAEKFSPEYNSDLCQFCKIKSICRRGELEKNIF